MKMFASYLFFLTLVLTSLKFSNSASIPCGVSILDNSTNTDFHHRIHNGTEARPYQWPWLAYIDLKLPATLRRTVTSRCTGTIVSPHYILTAAHCLQGIKDTQKQKVIVGSVDITSSEAKSVGVKRIVFHKQWDLQTISNDIGLIELSDSLNYTDSIREVCLSRKIVAEDHLSAQVVSIGWGLTERGKEPNILQQGSAIIAEPALCRNEYQQYNVTQQGDSGGPVLFRSSESKSWFELGILSYGSKDSERWDVYARVSHYCDWIAENSNNEVQCQT
ncbi:trypsin domain-containing protein [Ditylenchus destructor]|uniref:Trypsin domain-containing protein n=1 Tax=Ditylenchus destructor TaxID=166010 RepID=A0AAD4RE12_9BILA|nr:trypsin domain-containing protein [Ditylenchus destructor]